MEVLWLLKKKFMNRRIIYTIFEYLESRSYWLKIYREVIHKGCTFRNFRGVANAHLRYTPLCITILGYLYHPVGPIVSWKQRLFSLVHNLHKLDINYIIPTNMGITDGRRQYKFSKEMLLANCVENGMDTEEVKKLSRRKLIKRLMCV